MLKLFQTIFGKNDKAGRYPESLIEMANERAIEGTDPRLRALPGYRKRLRGPIIHAIDHVIALVDALSPPLPADSALYTSDPRLKALFISPEHLREVLGNDPAMNEYRRNHVVIGESVTALLLAQRIEKQAFGVEMTGETLRREVMQTSVSFRHHRLIDISASDEEARRQLKRRAFDHLISLALWRLTEMKSERHELSSQRDLLRCKLKALQNGGWSFEEQSSEQAAPDTLQTELDAIEHQLEALQTDYLTLNGQLDVVANLLADAEHQLWTEDLDLCLDRMNIKREPHDNAGQVINFKEMHNARGHSLIMLLVSLHPDKL